MDQFDETLQASWVVDSETSIQYLIDLTTGKVLAVKDENGVIQNVR